MFCFVGEEGRGNSDECYLAGVAFAISEKKDILEVSLAGTLGIATTQLSLLPFAPV